MPRGILLIARSATLLGVVALTALLSADRATAADTLEVGDKVTTKKTWFDIWENPTEKSSLARSQCSLPVKVERSNSPWIFIRTGGKAGWVRMAEFELADKQPEKKQGWTPPPDSSTWGAELDTAWPPPPSPLLAYAEDDARSDGKPLRKTPKQKAANAVVMPTGPIAVGDKIMPRDLTVALKYREKSSSKANQRERRASGGARDAYAKRAEKTKIVCTAAEINWPVKVRQIKGNWLWVEKLNDHRLRGWVRRTDVMTLADAPLYYTMRIMAAQKPEETARYYRLRAECRVEQDRKYDAIADFTSAIEADPLSGNYFARSSAYYYFDRDELDRAAEALADIDVALRLKGNWARAHLLRGQILLTLERPDECVAELDCALRLDPQYAEAWFRRGIVQLIARDEPQLGLRDIGRAIQLDPDVEYLSVRALAYLKTKDYARLLADVERGLQVDPKNWMLLGIKSVALLETGQPLFDIDPAALSDDALANLAVFRAIAFLQRKDYDAALAALDGIHLRERDAASMFFIVRVMVLMACDETAQAIAEIDRALASDPTSCAAHSMNIALLSKRHLHSQALCAASDAISRVTRAEDLSAMHLLRAASYTYFRFDLSAALADCEEAIRLDPKSASAFQQRAQVLLLMNRPAETLQSALQARALYEPNPTRSNTGVGFYYSKGKIGWTWGFRGRGRASIDPGEENSDESKQIDNYVVCSRAHLLLGEYGEAKADCERAVELDPNDDDSLAAQAEFLARCPDDRFRDPNKALAAARQSMRKSVNKSTAMALAAAHAAGGNFKAACFWQELVRDFASNKFVRAEAEDRLACYRQQRIATPAELVAMREARDGTERH